MATAIQPPPDCSRIHLRESPSEIRKRQARSQDRLDLGKRDWQNHEGRGLRRLRLHHKRQRDQQNHEDRGSDDKLRHPLALPFYRILKSQTHPGHRPVGPHNQRTASHEHRSRAQSRAQRMPRRARHQEFSCGCPIQPSYRRSGQHNRPCSCRERSAAPVWIIRSRHGRRGRRLGERMYSLSKSYTSRSSVILRLRALVPLNRLRRRPRRLTLQAMLTHTDMTPTD